MLAGYIADAQMTCDKGDFGLSESYRVFGVMLELRLQLI